MNNRLRLALTGGVVLVMLSSMGTTGALWRDEATVDAGTVTTGSLVLLVGGQEDFHFQALNALAGNLAPGESVRAPLTLTNGGSTGMSYSLTSVSAATVSPADEELTASLLLTVTVGGVCGDTPSTGELLLDHVPLAAAPTFTGTQLAPSSSETLCFEVALAADTPIAAAAGTTSVTFTFRGDQTS